MYDISQYYSDGEDLEAEEKINFMQACLKSSFDAECVDALKKITNKVLQLFLFWRSRSISYIIIIISNIFTLEFEISMIVSNTTFTARTKFVVKFAVFG